MVYNAETTLLLISTAIFYAESYLTTDTILYNNRLFSWRDIKTPYQERDIYTPYKKSFILICCHF